MERIIVASDSFKGSLSSEDVADAVERVFARMPIQYDVVKLIMSDGGEGFSEAVSRNIDAQRITIRTQNPLMDDVVSDYLINRSDSSAVIELAKASGLNLITPDRRNPLFTTTFGSGLMIADAIKRGCDSILMGMGGSATNDAGVGILTALGFRFLDSAKKSIKPIGANLHSICDVDDSQVDKKIFDVRFSVACDVENPFYGEDGAAFVYARQKGASDEDILLLDNGLRCLCDIVHEKYGKDMQAVSGAGAAGGAAGILWAILGAELVCGSSMMLDMCGFDSLVADSSLVITGEGRADSQTLKGKIPFGVLKASAGKIPVYLIAGSVENYTELREAGFAEVFSIISDDISLEGAMEPDFAKDKIEEIVSRNFLNL